MACDVSSRPMAPTKRAKPAPKPDESTPHAPAAVNLRGLTAADIEGVDRVVARLLRGAPKGAQLSRNAALLAIIREGIARSDANDAAPVDPVEARP